jgi:hypothetical protein
MTMTMTAVAIGGMMLKDNETRTLLRAAATAAAPLNVSSAPPPDRRRPISFMRGTWLGSCCLAGMLMSTTVQMTKGDSKQMNPFDY